MALHKMSNAQLDLRKNKNSEPEKKVEITRSEHAEEFLARVNKTEVMVDLKDKNRETSTEIKLNSKRNEKISDLKEKIKELKSTIDDIKIKPDNKQIIKNPSVETRYSASHKNDNKIKGELSINLETVETRYNTSHEDDSKTKKPTLSLTNDGVKQTLKFPEGFLWGTATSAYQIEGEIVNNWSKWEQSDKRKNELKKKKQTLDDYICGKACDSYNRYEEDFKLAKKMNNNVIRLGIEWARIQPRKNTWNVYVIKHYRKMLESAKKQGLTTFVTLWHWTTPSWFAKIDSWEKEENVENFLAYVNLVIKELGANIDYWVVLNEPIMSMFGSYVRGYHPPQKRNIIKAEKVFKNLVKAHKKSYKLIHKHFPTTNVGCANMLNYFEPADKWNPLEQIISGTANWYWNKRFLNKIKKYQDYVGVNYYFHNRMVWYPPFRANKNKWVNDNGWEIYPKGIYHVLKLASQYDKPIFITENGTSDKDDKDRIRFIKEHLRYIHQAINEGVDVRGYMHWSLLDNFEWSYGWKLKFGLHEVDRKTFKRTARPSAEEYGKICKSNEVEI